LAIGLPKSFPGRASGATDGLILTAGGHLRAHGLFPQLLNQFS